MVITGKGWEAVTPLDRQTMYSLFCHRPDPSLLFYIWLTLNYLPIDAYRHLNLWYPKNVKNMCFYSLFCKNLRKK